MYSLTVNKSDRGNGTVTSTPAGINCGLDYDELYADSTSSTLTATPDPDSKFTCWSGDADYEDGTITMTTEIQKKYSVII